MRWTMMLVAMSVPVPGTSAAQETQPVAGITVAGYYLGEKCCGGHDGSGGLGLLFGLEHEISTAISLRAHASAIRAIITADDVAICYPDANNGCIPDPIFPRLLVTAEVQSLVRVYPGSPLQAVIGLGVSRASDPREAERAAPATGLAPRATLLARTGLELTLGRSPRAPRVQWTRTHFRKDLYSLSKAEAVALLLRP